MNTRYVCFLRVVGRERGYLPWRAKCGVCSCGGGEGAG